MDQASSGVPKFGNDRGQRRRSRIAVLHQGFIPTYRERFFELLNTATGNEYVVFHGDAPRASGHRCLPGPFAFPNVRVHNRETGLGRTSIIYQPVLRAILGGGFDAVVVGHEIKFAASMIIFGAFKALGKPALLWGHGLHRANAMWPARASSSVLARAADAYLVYAGSGAAALKQAGVDGDRIFVVRNTLDMPLQQRARQRVEGVPGAVIRDRLGLSRDSQVLLCIGRLVPHKAVDALIEAARRMASLTSTPPVEMLIVGDGPQRAALEVQASGLPNIRFLGDVYDPDEVAKLMKIAVAVVVPGTVGLVVNHAFAFGKPIVTRESRLHAPEIEYVESGRNGLIAGPSVESLTETLARLLKDAALQESLSAGALATAAALGLEHSVQQFDCGVRFAIGARSSALAGDRGGPAGRHAV